MSPVAVGLVDIGDVIMAAGGVLVRAGGALVTAPIAIVGLLRTRSRIAHAARVLGIMGHAAGVAAAELAQASRDLQDTPSAGIDARAGVVPRATGIATYLRVAIRHH